MKTIKQIADEMGLPKQTVYRYIRKHCVNEALQKQGTKYYDEVAEQTIVQGLSTSTASNEVPRSASLDTVAFDVLQKQLEIKDRQIAEQAKTIQDLTNALTASQALHAGTIQTNLIGESEDVDEPPRGFWQRLFGKK